MPKARSAILSSLRGTLKGGPTFRANPQTDGITMQTKPVPTGNPTAKQTAVRNAYARLAYLWKNLSNLDKEPYQIMAEARNLTPWNCWLSFHMPIMRLTPKLYIPFAEGTGTTIQDFAIGGYSASINGSVWQEINQFPTLYFDGVDDRVTFTQRNYYDALSNFSVFALVALSTSPAQSRGLLATKNSTTQHTGIRIYIPTNNRPVLGYGSGSTSQTLQATNALTPSAINTLAIIKNGTSLTFYINGLQNTVQATNATITPAAQNFTIGNYPNNAGDYLGKIPLLSIIPSVLDSAQVAALDTYYKPFFT